MKVGYFIGHFPYMDLVNDASYTKAYAHGGTEIAAYYLALEMAKKGNNVHVFTSSIDYRDSDEIEKDMKIHRYGTNFKIASANVALKLINKPLKYNLDIVHSHSPIPYSDLPAMFYAKKKKVPYVLTYQFDGQETGGSFVRNTGVKVYNRYLLKKVLNYADMIIATTQSYAKESMFLRYYQDKITIIPNGINIEEFNRGYSKEECRKKLGLPTDKHIILFFGSLVAYKGPDILLRAFSMVKNSISDVQLVFAGRGEMLEELKIISRKFNLERDITFAGFVSEDLKPLYYTAADIFCLPSTNLGESFGIVNLEAIACGTPVVSTRLGGIPDVIEEGKNGLLAEPNNEKSLAEKLIQLLEDDDLARKMGDYGKQKVNDYSWERIAEKTEDVYKELISNY